MSSGAHPKRELSWSLEILEPQGADRRRRPRRGARQPDRECRPSRTLARSGRGMLDGDAVLVTVADDGPGIPADRRAEALSRGGRLDTSSPTGLGLAIVSEIAEAWDACFSISDEEPGLKASLRFPCS